MAFNKSEAPRRSARPMHRRKKVCVFCGKENNEIDYKDTAKLKKYVSERGKIKNTGNRNEIIKELKDKGTKEQSRQRTVEQYVIVRSCQDRQIRTIVQENIKAFFHYQE